MKITVVSVGKTKQSFIKEGEEEYLPRILAWAPFEIKELGSESSNATPVEVAKEREATALKKFLKEGDHLVILDERGTKMTSEKFAQFFRSKMNEGTKRVVFAIGGAYGWPESLTKEAPATLSLSPMTFTYQMTRLILVEQIYRALSLVKGVPYHK